MHEAILNPIFSIFREPDLRIYSLSSFSSASSTCRGSSNTLSLHENNNNYSNNYNNNHKSNHINNNYHPDLFMKNSNLKHQDHDNNNNNLYRNHSSTSDSDFFDKKNDFLLPFNSCSFERHYMHYYKPDFTSDNIGAEKLPLL